MAVEFTKDNFDAEVLKSDKPVLVDFWAPWCGPCRSFAPIFEAAAERHADVVFGKINTDEEQELAGSFGISSIPTVMVFRDGIGVFQQPGMLPAQALDKLLDQVRALNMDDVRKELDSQHEEH